MKTRISALILIAVAPMALAHSGATGIVKERMDAMKEMSYATKALGAVRAGVIPYSEDVIARAAAALIRHGEAGKTQFPEGSLEAPSEALPSIWTDRAAFDRLFDELIAAAGELGAAPDEPTAMVAAEKVAASCKACHARFREKKL